MLKLKVEKRAGGASAAVIRRAGSVPGIVYGPHQAATPLSVDARAFEKVFREAGESSIVSLEGLPAGRQGFGAALPTLIHEVDLDPVTHLPRHVDFYAVTKGEKIEVAIPLLFIGESEAVRLGANLVRVLHEIKVEADPMNLPHEIEVDLTALAAIGDRIVAKDVRLPASVALITEPEEVVVLAQEVVEEKEEAPAAADLGTIEVEKKGKEEPAPES